jgi:hypothetical protein
MQSLAIVLRLLKNDDGSAAGDMMVPVVGIGVAYQHAGQGSSGHRWAGFGVS